MMMEKIVVDFRGSVEGVWRDADIFAYPPPDGSEVRVAIIRGAVTEYLVKVFDYNEVLIGTQSHYNRAEALVAAFDHALSLEGINVNRDKANTGSNPESLQEHVAESETRRGSKPRDRKSDDPRYS